MSNDLTIEVYSSGITPVYDLSDKLPHAQAVSFETFWPGGLFGEASLYVPKNLLTWWSNKGAKRIIFRNGLNVVYEGEIDSLTGEIAEDSEGMLITCTGFWGTKIMRRRLRRYYIDRRVSEDAWAQVMIPGGGAGGGGESKFNITRSDDLGDVLLFVPENVALVNTDLARLDYACPTGEAIKKVVFDYDYTEKAGENFTGSLNDATGGAAAFTVSATGTADEQAWTAAAAAATTQIYFQLASGASQTPTGDSQTYFEISDLRVYAWTSNSGNFADNMDEVAKDIVAEFTGVFNGDVTKVTTPGSPYTLTNFICDWLTLAEVLTKVASYGDGATPPNQYAVYLLDSESATTPNGLPVLVMEVYPALTSYDYGVRLSDTNIVGSVNIRQDLSQIANWIIVSYQTAGGGTAYLTPDTQATLTDATSIAAYGQRDMVLDFGNADAATALQLGKHYLAQWKNPVYVLDSTIDVQSYILDNNNQPIPACKVRAGKRIRILDYFDDLSGTGLTMYVIATNYDAETETVSITTGYPDDLAAMIARLELAVGLGPEDIISHRPDRAKK